jgi:hypothetical protein
LRQEPQRTTTVTRVSLQDELAHSVCAGDSRVNGFEFGRRGDTQNVPPAANRPDLHRDRRGLVDDADRRAIHELRFLLAGILAAGIGAWALGAGGLPLFGAVIIACSVLQCRTWLIRRSARRNR